MKPICCALALMPLPAFLLGCGSDPGAIPAGGSVKFADGTPLAGGQIQFQLASDGAAPTARGTIGADGTFQLTTFEEDDGALPGKHRVMITPLYEPIDEDWEDKLLETGKQPQPKKADGPQMDPRYQTYKTSKLTYTVTEDASQNQFEIVVDAQ